MDECFYSPASTQVRVLSNVHYITVRPAKTKFGRLTTGHASRIGGRRRRAVPSAARAGADLDIRRDNSSSGAGSARLGLASRRPLAVAPIVMTTDTGREVLAVSTVSAYEGERLASQQRSC